MSLDHLVLTPMSDRAKSLLRNLAASLSGPMGDIIEALHDELLDDHAMEAVELLTAARRQLRRYR